MKRHLQLPPTTTLVFQEKGLPPEGTIRAPALYLVLYMSERQEGIGMFKTLCVPPHILKFRVYFGFKSLNSESQSRQVIFRELMLLPPNVLNDFVDDRFILRMWLVCWVENMLGRGK